MAPDDLGRPGQRDLQAQRQVLRPGEAKVGTVKLIAYTSTQAEENDLEAGKLDFGFVDPGMLTSPRPRPARWDPTGARSRASTAW